MQEAIARLYQVTPQQLALPMNHCSCGCCDHIDFRHLERVSRKELDFGTLEKYAQKALTKVGEVEHYQYFLPRICDMIWEGKAASGVELCLIDKLEYGKFQEWQVPLKNAVVDFLSVLLRQRKFLTDWEIAGIEKLVQSAKMK